MVLKSGETVVSTSGSTEPAAPGQRLRHGKLGVFAIVFFVIAAVAPLGSIVGGAPVVFAAIGVTAPMAYLAVGVLFAVFAAGFVAMSRHVTNAAGFVAFIAKGLGSRFGGALAAVAVLGYVALVCGLWAITAGIAESTMAGLGLAVPGWVWWVVGLVIVTTLCAVGIEVSLRVLGVLVVLEICTLLFLAITVIAGGGATGSFDLQSFNPANVVPSGVGIAILFAATCYAGFEATVVFSEEAKNPARTIPRAAYLAIAVIGVFYAFITWVLANAWGASEVQAAAQADPVGFVFAVAATYGPSWLPSALGIIMLVSSMAMFIGFHNLLSRYLFSLGRSGMLPAALARTSKSGTPRVAVLGFSAVVFVVVGGFLVFGADLMTVIYPWLTSLGTVALVLVLLFTCMAIVAYFAGKGAADARIWHTRIAPVIAGIGFLIILLLAVVNYDALLGGSGGVARWLILLIPVAFIGGLIRADRQRRAGRELTFEDSPV
ncbi:APC family permease [Herbiconiux sp. A18JL235]|uniref:APC family permease n=1 Tax=Herbiconiux sp. A18JL235 TaxID=3152363 RepID=A0AB39BHS9_9MICO